MYVCLSRDLIDDSVKAAEEMHLIEVARKTKQMEDEKIVILSVAAIEYLPLPFSPSLCVPCVGLRSLVVVVAATVVSTVHVCRPRRRCGSTTC